MTSIRVKPYEEIKLKQRDEEKERQIRQENISILSCCLGCVRVLYMHRFL